MYDGVMLSVACHFEKKVRSAKIQWTRWDEGFYTFIHCTTANSH